MKGQLSQYKIHLVIVLIFGIVIGIFGASSLGSALVPRGISRSTTPKYCAIDIEGNPIICSPRHLACVGQSCAWVPGSGPGSDECSSNQNCGPQDTCSDTDGGINEEVQGTVSGMQNGQGYNFTDFCFGNNTLTEYYCGGSTPFNLNIDCTGNYTFCINGACV